MKNEIISFFLNLNFVHKNSTLNEIQQYIDYKVTNYLYNATMFSHGNHNYKAELFNKLIENIEIIINEKCIFFNFNNNFDFDRGFVIENYIKYLNECFVKKNDFIQINDSTFKVNPFVLDFEYIKWAIRNLKWFILLPSFFESKFTVNQIVELKNTSNLLFEFKFKEKKIIVKDYLNEEDYILNLLKQNIKFDAVNKVYTFKEMTIDSFENYLLDDNISFDMVLYDTEKWGNIGKIIYELTHEEEAYYDTNIETASEGDWLKNAAGTDDPQTMNDVFWNLDQIQMRAYNLTSDFDFGKYRNQKIEYVVLNDINYIIWCIKEIEDLIFHKDVIELVIKNKDNIFADTNEIIHSLNKDSKDILDDLENNKIINIVKTNNLKINISKNKS